MKLDCGCDTTYFGHEEGCPNKAPVKILTQAKALADEAKAYAWQGGPQTIRDREVLDACQVIGRPQPDGLPYPELAAWILELGRFTDDYNRLAMWMELHTKAKSGNAVTDAIAVLDVCHMAARHMSPAIRSMITSVVSAFQAAGVDIPSYFTPTEPSLGLATTEEMLVELKARGRGSWGYIAEQLLGDLPDEALKYRTVDE
jgi:hypothetical protein